MPVIDLKKRKPTKSVEVPIQFANVLTHPIHLYKTHSLESTQKLEEIARAFLARVCNGVVRSAFVYEIDHDGKPRDSAAFEHIDRSMGFSVLQLMRDLDD